VTFLFTDVEGSTRLWATHTAAMELALARHDEVLREAIEAHDGYVFSLAGDSFGAAFSSPEAGLGAAIDAQVELNAERWNGLPDGMRVRMGLHVGRSHERAGNYFGPEVNLAARVMSAAWGGQILCTGTFAALVDPAMPALGEHRLRDVERRIALHQVAAPGVSGDFPPPRTLDIAPTTLPSQRSTFVGRGPDIGAVRRLLLDHSLVTLTGPGGTGKTRLAIEIAGREQPLHQDGTFFADLSSVEDDDHVAVAVARACLVSLDASRPPVDQLTDSLASRSVLLVLDNCEHVLDAVAGVADRLLAACPKVSLIATSREPLQLPGEHLHVIAPLDTEPGGDAANLFVQRAAAAGGDMLDVTDASVSQLCSRLDGIPLAIELAAARARTSSPDETIARLDRQLDLLAPGRRRVPERHQTLRAAISWSYELLESTERALFDRLSVFTGSFDVAAAAAVGGVPIGIADDFLHGLVSKSMVEIGTARGAHRYRLLYSLRAYADERLQASREFDAAIAAHTAYYLERLSGIPAWRNVARALWTELEPDLDNLLSAVDRAATAPDAALRLAAARATEPVAFLLTSLGLYTEARRRCDLALTESLDAALRGRLLVARAFLEASEDGISDYVSFASRALEFLHPGDGVWSAAMGMTSVASQMFLPNEPAATLEAALTALDDARAPGAEHDRAMLLYYRGGALMNLRQYERAAELESRSAEILAALEPTSLIRLFAASAEAISLTLLGDVDRAHSVLDEVASLADWTDWSADYFFARALAYARAGKHEDAHETLRSIGVRFDHVDVSPMVSTVVAGFGIVAHLSGDDDRARELFDPLSATRAPASTAALYETIATMEHWPADEFRDRKLHHLLAIAERFTPENRPEFFGTLRALLREELARA
jgi:predicted ATPase/class 3 adenylate cyclase